MKQLRQWLAGAAGALSLAGALPDTAAAGFQPRVSFQGRVTVDGVSFDGTGQFRFSLLAPPAASPVWTHGVSNAVLLPVTRGVYTVTLGDTNQTGMGTLSADVFTNANLSLRVSFSDGTNGFEVLSPDLEIRPVAWSVRALQADESAVADLARSLPDALVSERHLESTLSNRLSGIEDAHARIATERSDRIAALAAQLDDLLNGTQVYTGSNHYTGAVVATNTANVLHGKFVGNGSGLQGIPVGSLNGVLANGQLPGTVVYRPELLSTNAALNTKLTQEATDRADGDASVNARMDAETNILHGRIAIERSDRITALAAQLSDLLNGAQIYTGSNHYTGAVVATNTANVLHGKFVGNGSGLQGIPVGSLNGVLANGQLPGTVVYRPELLSTNAALNTKLTQEATDRGAGDTALANRMDLETNTLHVKIATERSDRIVALAAQLSDLLNGAQIYTGSNHYTGAVVATNTANVLHGKFVGNGSGLQGIPVGSLNGVLANGQLPGTVVYRSELLSTNAALNTKLTQEATDRADGDASVNARMDAETNILHGRINVSSNTLHGRITTERSDRIAALAAQLSDLLNGAQIYTGSNHYNGAVVATNTANVLHGKFVGNGSGLQGIPVGSLNGVLANGQLPGTVVYRSELLSTNAALNTKLTQEATDRADGDASVNARMDAETNILHGRINVSSNTLHGRITTERSDRIAALAAQLSDLLNGAQIYTGSNHYTGAVVATNTANVLHGKFVGNGSGLQGIPVGSLNGVLANGQLPGTVVYRSELLSTDAALNAKLTEEATFRADGDASVNARMDVETNILHGRINVSSNTLHGRIATERSDRITALAAQLSDLLNGAQIYTGSNHYNGAVVATNTANVLHGKFVGNGSGLQGIPVGSLNGVLANGQLPGTVVYRPELLSTNAALNTKLTQEATFRADGDASVNARMDVETNILHGRINVSSNTLHGRIATERSDRITALAAQLSDLLNGAQIYTGSNHYTGAVVATNTANVLHGKFVGNGSGLGNLDALKLTSGTMADQRLSSNVMLSDGTRAFGAAVSGVAPTADLHLATKKYVDDSVTNASAGSLPGGAVLASSDMADATYQSAGYVRFASIAPPAWGQLPTAGQPSARWGHVTLRTGDRVTVWGGRQGSAYLNDGAIYRSASDDWVTMSPLGAPSARIGMGAVWTDAKMIVFGGFAGGFLNSGGIFDPTNDAWSPLLGSNPPSVRVDHSMVWNGSRALVFGGQTFSGMLNDLHGYDPNAGNWMTWTPTNAPAGRRQTRAIWTGDRLLVWGGDGNSGKLGDGAMLSFAGGTPAASWVTISSMNAPSARRGHGAVWTGSRLVVWGGENDSSVLGDGALFDPVQNSWTSMATAPIAGATGHAMVWTGSEVLVIGGRDGTGVVQGVAAAYDPVGDTWRLLSNPGAVVPRADAGAVWTGSRLWIFGGRNTANLALTAGQQVDPSPAWHLYRRRP